MIVAFALPGFSAEEDKAKTDRAPKEKGKGRPDLQKLDKDGDKAISKEEAGPKLWERLGKLDKNSDGKIAGDEFRRPGGGLGPDGKAKDRGEFLKRLDKNGDGNISKEEAPEQVWERLSKLDKNNDGAVSKDEFPTRPQPGEFFARMDKNSDGKLTKDEVPEQFWERIGAADSDKDGAVTKEEMTKGIMARMRARGMDGKGGKGRAAGGPGPIFGRFDKDSDGKLTKEEVPAEMWSKISRADDDADGTVSKAELEAVYKKMRDANPNRAPKKKADDKPDRPKRPEFDA